MFGLRIVHFQNEYMANGKRTYLDVRQAGCENNAMCVSTSYQADRRPGTGTGRWKIICSQGDITKPVSLENQYKYIDPTYLDVRGEGCENNALCVSTSFEPNRNDNGSGLWTFEFADVPQPTVSSLSYGDIFYVQNQYPYNDKPTYLDVRQPGCENNAYCVSTSEQADRRPGTGTGQWKIISAEGKTGTMQCGDIVHLVNQYIYSDPTYLDIKGRGCEGNAFCVSTTSVPLDRDTNKTSSWKIMCSEGDITQPILLENQYIYNDPTYLDARGAGCEGNIYCVSTSVEANRNPTKGSGLWRFVPTNTPSPFQSGQVYRFQNQYLYQGQPTYLEATTQQGCKGEAFCVVTDDLPDRAIGYGRWRMTLTSGESGTIECGDEVFLRNEYPYDDKYTYLSVRGMDCNGNALCVSTTFNADPAPGVSRWKIMCTDEDITKPISLQNQYLYNGRNTYLDVKGNAIGKVFWVSTSVEANRNSGSGKWKIEPF